MEKSAGGFQTISQVAEEVGVTQHTLRFWETKFGQLRPMKRAGGRRYYRSEDLEIIKTIQFLLDERGFTLKMAQKVLREHGVQKAKTIQIAPNLSQTQKQEENDDALSADSTPMSKTLDLVSLKESLVILRDLRAKF
ncbi:MAG: MerR family transcriptional regulator [Alphaproteobacteria bacterium]